MDQRPGDHLVPGKANETMISLSQVLLAPLDALFKAQVHAARSFLNFILQLSYDHKDERPGGPAPAHPDRIYSVDFVHEVPAPPARAGEPSRGTIMQKVSVPALSLVPLRPLTVEEAEFNLAMEVTWIAPHRQTRQNERQAAVKDAKASGEDRPWYLVDDPISLRGHVAPDRGGEQVQGENPVIKINVKVSPTPLPSGLEKLLATLTQSASVSNEGGAGGKG